MNARLVAAGAAALDEGLSVPELTARDIARRCDTDLKNVFAAFSSWLVYLGDVAEHLLDDVTSEAIAAGGEQAADAERLCRMAESWLDAHLQRSALHRLHTFLHGTEVGAALRQSQQSRWLGVCEAELRRGGGRDGKLAARMAAALVLEVLAQEQLAGSVLPESREKVRVYLRRVAA